MSPEIKIQKGGDHCLPLEHAPNIFSLANRSAVPTGTKERKIVV